MNKNILICVFCLSLFFHSSVKALEPASDDVLTTQASAFYTSRNYESALNSFQQIKAKDKETYLLIANCYESIGQEDKAFETLNSLTKNFPTYPNAYYNLAVLSFDNNEYENAIKNFKTVLKYQKDFIPALFDLGNAYYQINDYKKAESSYQKALDLDKNFADACYNIYLCYKKMNKQKEAEKYLLLYKNMQTK